MTANTISLQTFENMEIIMRSLSDPVWFIENVLQQPLWPAQKEMIRNFYRHKYKRGAKPFKRCVLAWGQRCNDGESFITTRCGIKKLKDIEPGDEVWSISGWKPVIEVYDVGVKDSVYIKTELGFTQRCSTEHKWLTKRGWVMAKDLTLDDKILLEVPNCNNTTNIINERTAMIMGYLIAEGTITKDDMFRFTNGDECTLNHFDHLVCDQYGYMPRRTKRGIDSVINKVSVIKELRLYGLLPARAKTKTIPYSVLQSSASVKAAFLRAYFEGDGWACNNSNVPEVGCSTISFDLAKQVQLVLLELGIVSSVVTKRPHAFSSDYEISKNIPYHVKINGINIFKFRDIVGFISERKTNVLNDCCNTLSTRNLKPSSQQRFLKIKEIKELEPVQMYDLLVKDSHSYLCNGLMSHNSGKTAMMACIGLYEMFEICCLENPSKHYGLIKDQIIMIAVLSPSEDQTLRGVYGNMVNYVDNCPFLKDFMGWEASKKSIYSPTKNVRIEPFGSWAHTGRGTTAKAVIFDEMDYFEETTNRRGGQEVYTAMANATTTLGDDAHVFVISSLKSSVSTVSRMLTDAAIEAQTVGYDNTTTYTECKPTWEINPNISFEDCKKICNNNMIELWRNFGCKPSAYSSMTFPNGVELKTMTNVLNPLVTPAKFRPRVMAIDPALKNDTFGLAVGYRGEDGIIYIDGVLKYRKREGDITISPKEIKGFVKKAITLLGVGTLIYDIYMFPDILEMAETMGVMTQQHIVRKADYDTLRSLMEQKMCTVVYDAELKKEFEELENKSEKKCDHPIHGCFTGDTRVILCDGTTPTMAELEGKEVYVVSSDKYNNPKAGLARCRKTKEVTELLEIVLDSGASIKCTPEHLFMMRDGSYKQAMDLVCYTDRLMPCNITTDADGYTVFRNKDGIKAPMHRFIMGLSPEDRTIVHHKNENKNDNRPENLEVMTPEQHSRYHGLLTSHENGTNAMHKFNTSETGRKLRRDVGKKSLISTGDYTIRRKWAEINKSFRHDITLEKIIESKNLGANNPYQSAKILGCGRNVIMRVLKENKFNTWEEFLNGLNHRVKAIYRIKLSTPIPVYDLEVDTWNNFALLAGVFVHNSKDAADCVANIAWFLTTNEPIDLVNNFVSINTF